MPDIKYTKVIVLVILSGIVAYRYLKSKRMQNLDPVSKHHIPFTSTMKALRIKSLMHRVVKKNIAKPHQAH